MFHVSSDGNIKQRGENKTLEAERFSIQSNMHLMALLSCFLYVSKSYIFAGYTAKISLNSTDLIRLKYSYQFFSTAQYKWCLRVIVMCSQYSIPLKFLFENSSTQALAHNLLSLVTCWVLSSTVCYVVHLYCWILMAFPFRVCFEIQFKAK